MAAAAPCTSSTSHIAQAWALLFLEGPRFDARVRRRGSAKGSQPGAGRGRSASLAVSFGRHIEAAHVEARQRARVTDFMLGELAQVLLLGDELLLERPLRDSLRMGNFAGVACVQLRCWTFS